VAPHSRLGQRMGQHHGLRGCLVTCRHVTDRVSESGQPVRPAVLDLSVNPNEVFASPVGTPLDYSNLRQQVWVPARDAAGIDPDEYGAFHRLRNTLGSLLHERSDKSDRQLCDWLGHHDPAFSVRRYTGTMDEGLGSAEFLDELIPIRSAKQALSFEKRNSGIRSKLSFGRTVNGADRLSRL
jgi:hypothetical protein